MRLKTLLLSFLFLTVFFSFVGPKHALATNVTLSGHVYGGSSNALPNQTVSLQQGSTTVATTTTDSNGYYSLTVASGTYNILLSYNTAASGTSVAYAPNWYNLTIPSYALSSDTTQDIQLPVQEVSVHVQDPSDAAVVNAYVKTNNITANNLSVAGVTNAYGSSRYGFGDNGAETDSSGNVDLWLYAPNTSNPYILTSVPPSGSSLAMTSISNVSFTSNTSVTITMQYPVTLSGQITGGDSIPLANQSISLMSGSTTVATTTSDSSGNYSISAAPGTYNIYLSYGSDTSQSEVPYWYTLTIPSYSLTGNTTQNLQLPVMKQSFHVQDMLGNSVANAYIKTNNITTNYNSIAGVTNAYGSSRYGFGDSGAETDSSGNVDLWVFDTNPSNSYTFTVVPPSGSVYTTTTLSSVSVSGDASHTVTMQQPTVTLSGHVYGGNTTALPNQTVSLLYGSYTVATTTTDSSGNYSLSAPSGTYNIYVSYGDSTQLSSAPYWYNLTIPSYSLSGNTTQDIQLPVYEVSVHVQDPSSDPESNVYIKTNNVTANNLSVAGVTNAYGSSRCGFGDSGAETDSSGNVDLWLYAPNSSNPYVLTAFPPSGSSYAITSLTNVSFTSDTSATITLQLPITLSGHVYGGSSSTLPNQTVSVQSTANSNVVANTTTDSDGNYSVSVAPGSYDITLSYDTATTGTPLTDAPYWYTVTIPSYSVSSDTTYDIQLPLKQVSLHVQDSSGNPVANTYITTNNIDANSLVFGSITNGYGSSRYGFGDSGVETDSSGNATMWLFPSSNDYNFTATPPSGSGFSTTNLNNISITSDSSETIILNN